MNAFTATLYKNGSSYCVDIPASVTSAWSDRHVPVELVVEGLVDRTTAVRRKDGGYRVFVRISIRELAGLKAGSEATVRLERARERRPEHGR